mgnify:CR=1 FL=1
MQSVSIRKFCGQEVSKRQFQEIKEIIGDFPNLSRTELASTICELFDWKRPTGKLKTVECRQWLESLADKKIIILPDRKPGRPKGKSFKVQASDITQVPQDEIIGPLKTLLPIKLKPVENKSQRVLWYDYIERYHYLGFQLPFGCQLRYFIEGYGQRLLGCLQFSSPAWKMAPRDNWIGWNDRQRRHNLQKIINNSRFLIFPWVKVKNLASSILSLACSVVPGDWEKHFAYQPVLMETLVDQHRFSGTCYKAANWIHVGVTTGRGRMDRENKRHGLQPKEIYVYPLRHRFREELVKG